MLKFTRSTKFKRLYLFLFLLFVLSVTKILKPKRPLRKNSKPYKCLSLYSLQSLIFCLTENINSSRFLIHQKSKWLVSLATNLSNRTIIYGISHTLWNKFSFSQFIYLPEIFSKADLWIMFLVMPSNAYRHVINISMKLSRKSV